MERWGTASSISASVLTPEPPPRTDKSKRRSYFPGISDSYSSCVFSAMARQEKCCSAANALQKAQFHTTLNSLQLFRGD